MTRRATAVTDEMMTELKRYYSEGEIVEIAMVVGLFNYFNRFNEALGLQPTQPGEGLDT